MVLSHVQWLLDYKFAITKATPAIAATAQATISCCSLIAFETTMYVRLPVMFPPPRTSTPVEPGVGGLVGAAVELGIANPADAAHDAMLSPTAQQ